MSADDYTLHAVRTPADLDVAYRILDGWFGVRGELERRAVFEDWASTPDGRWVDGPGASRRRVRHHVTLARAADGSVAGVRDTHVIFDPAGNTCVVYLSHAFVEPAHRRTGLAGRLRTHPLDLARADLAAWGAGDADVILAVEQEPVATGVDDTLIRLVAYGRSGFRAVPASVFPYCQPDFGDVAATGAPARPLPLLAVIRHVGHEAETELPMRLAEAYLHGIYAVGATHCRPADLAAPREHALAGLRAHRAAVGLHALGAGTVPLLPLPRDVHDAVAIAALHEDACRPYFPAAWWRDRADA